MKDLAARAGVGLENLEKEAAGLAAGKDTAAPRRDAAETVPAAAERKLTRRELLAEHYLAALATTGDFTSDEDMVFYLPEPYRDIFELLKRGERRSPDPAVDERLNAILLVGEDLSGKERAELKEQIRREYLRERREELAAEVRRAESAGDDAALQKALKELAELPSK
jgi:hypothetical protein